MNISTRIFQKASCPGRLAFAAVAAMIVLSLFVLNLHTPMQMDDYDYSFSWATGERITRAGQIPASLLSHYRLWGGRLVTHGLTQLFLLLPEAVFDLLNALAYLCLLLEVLYLSGQLAGGSSWALLLLLHAVLMAWLPFFGTVFLWLDGSCNYLWGTLIALLPLVREHSRGNRPPSPADWLLWLPLSLAAGWTNENTAPAVLVTSALLLFRKGRNRTAFDFACLLFQTAGVLLLLLAPGNFSRAESYSFLQFLLSTALRTVRVLYYAVVYTAPALTALILLLALNPGQAARLWPLIACAALSVLALAASPEVSDRVYTGTLFLLLIPACRLSGTLLEEHASARRALLWVLPVLLVLLLSQTRVALQDVTQQEARLQANQAAIQAAREAGESRAFLRDVPGLSPFTMDNLLSGDSGEWPNRILGVYTGLEILRSPDGTPSLP